MNNFNKLAKTYSESSFKPDKQFSMLPTLLSLLKLDKSSTVIDIGCGEGFFTIPIAKQAKRVIGIDSSSIQLSRAAPALNVKYFLVDMKDYDYPECDRISCPFVLNYILSLEELTALFSKFFRSLKEGGRIASILDMPHFLIHNNKEFGSVKRVKGDHIVEGAPIEIKLYDKNRHLVSLESIFHEKRNIENCLSNAGFSRFFWEQPIFSEEGIASLGEEFWNRYKANCDVTYLVAIK